MTCSEFVERFTDFLDGEGSEAFHAEAEAHMEACSGCRRYHQVMVQGRAVLRSLPEATVPEDFQPRLQHRLYHVDDEAALSAHAASGATVFTVLGMSMLLTALAWSPTLRPSAPVVEIPPIVVSEPPLRMRPVNALPADAAILRPAWARRGTDLWDDAQALLYEYSPLQQRYRENTPPRRAGLD
jgi:anti-sigma factor RsiW